MADITITGSSTAGVVPSVGGEDISAHVRIAIGDTDSSNYELSNADLALLMQDAVGYYQRLKPYFKQTTITLVANQSDYALPSDCIKPIHIPYRVFDSIASPTIVSLFGLNGFLSVVPYLDWKDDVLNKWQSEMRVRFDTLGAGQAEEITYLTSYAATRYLRLYPTPSSSGSFVLRYSANHPLQNNDYFTIPSDHAVYIQKLLIAEVFDVRDAAQLSNVSEFQAGTTRIKVGGGGKGQSLGDRAASLRQEVWDALSRPVGRVG
jgi:hypothetical protein